MIPLKDDAPRVGTPFVTYTLIAANVVVFLFELMIGPGGREVLFLQLGVVPAFIQSVAFNHGYLSSQATNNLLQLAPQLGQIRYVTSGAAFVPLLTSMFIHGGWLHLLFNMWFLWIFGDNVEDSLGHGWYLLFYFVCGIAASLFYTLLNAGSVVPTVGASGAIAGVMGGYFVIYPRARVLTLVPFFFIFFMWLPAWIILGYWFVGQFLSGAATSLGVHGGNQGGIAFWAHVGGFLTGIFLIKLFPARTRRYYYGL